MKHLLLSICLLIVLSSCQQRYWQVKKVRVNPTHKMATQNEEMNSQNIVSLSLDSFHLEQIQSIEAPINTIQSLEPIPLSNDSISIEIHDEIVKEYETPPVPLESLKDKLNPIIPNQEIPTTSSEFLFVLSAYLFFTLLCVLLTTALFYPILFFAATSLSQMAITALLYILTSFIGLIIAWSKCVNLIEKTLKRELYFIVLFCGVLLAGAITIGLVFIFLQNIMLAVLLSLLLFVLSLIYLLRFIKKANTVYKSFDNDSMEILE